MDRDLWPVLPAEPDRKVGDAPAAAGDSQVPGPGGATLGELCFHHVTSVLARWPLRFFVGTGFAATLLRNKVFASPN